MTSTWEPKPVNVHGRIAMQGAVGDLLPNGTPLPWSTCRGSEALHQSGQLKQAMNQHSNHDPPPHSSHALTSTADDSPEITIPPLPKKASPSDLKEDPTKKVLRLERSLHFLKEQHQHMLAELHTEIEQLQRKNKELQYHIIMGTPLITNEIASGDSHIAKGSSHNTSKGHTHTIGVQTIDVGEVSKSRRSSETELELRQLKSTLQSFQDRNAYLTNLVDQLKQSTAGASTTSNAQITTPLNPDDKLSHSITTWSEKHFAELPLPFARRFREYEDSIRRLRAENEDLKHEMNAMRGDLQTLQVRSQQVPKKQLMSAGSSVRIRERPTLPHIPKHMLKSYQARQTKPPQDEDSSTMASCPSTDKPCPSSQEDGTNLPGIALGQPTKPQGNTNPGRTNKGRSRRRKNHK